MKAALTSKLSYSRRRPELTPCYKIIQEHDETFKAEREAEGRPLPDYVAEEFKAYLRCGILAWGFVRVKCDQCKDEMVVALSTLATTLGLIDFILWNSKLLER